MRPGWLIGHRFNDGQEVDRQHAAVVVRTLSGSRLVLSAFALVAILADPPDAPVLPTQYFLLPLLVAFVAYSVAVMIAAGVRPAGVFAHGLLLQSIDLGWIVALTVFSDGANSAFFAFFLYAVLAAGYRWGLPATLATGLFAIVVLVGETLVNRLVPFSHPVHFQTAMMRAIYQGVPAVLIGLLAEEEWRQRSRSRALTRIMTRVRADAGLVPSVRAVFDEVLTRLKAARGVLTLEEEGGNSVFLWHVRRPAAGKPLDVRLVQQPRTACDSYLFPLPPQVDVLRVRRVDGTGRFDVVTLDGHGVRMRGAETAAAALLGVPIECRTAVCVPEVSGEGWKGRLFVFDAGRTRDHDLRFLQTVVRQVAPALFNLYLQRRLRSRDGVVDRLRVSRELHDGVIQSLIGLEMELEVLRREAEPCMPEATRRQLGNIQSVLGREILSVRDLMQTLQPVDIEPRQLLEHLAETLEGFRHKTGIQARLLSSVDRIDLPRRICNELVRIVQEALANIRKHSGASNVLVRLESADGRWQITIDDDGKGFDFEGRLTDEVLDAERRGPVIIKERLKGIGGRLAIDSRPGHGARLEISIPR